LRENQWKINENWMKFQVKLEPIWAQNQLKISYFWDKIHRKSIKINQNPDQFLYYPLLNFERKSLKIDNKFIKNQWKSMKSLAIFERKSAIFEWNLDQILAQFYPKSSQFWPNFMGWDNKMNNGFGLRGHFQASTPITSISNLKILGG